MDEIPQVRALSLANIETEAEAFLDKFYPDCALHPTVLPIDEFIDSSVLRENFGFEYAFEELPPGILGLTDFTDKKLILSPQTYEGLLSKNPMARFTAAHEVGHVVLHGTQLSNFSSPGNRSHYATTAQKFQNYRVYCDPEWQANQFAASILMPRKHMVNLQRKSYYDLSQIFGVSTTAAAIRQGSVLRKMSA